MRKVAATRSIFWHDNSELLLLITLKRDCAINSLQARGGKKLAIKRVRIFFRFHRHLFCRRKESWADRAWS